MCNVQKHQSGKNSDYRYFDEALLPQLAHMGNYKKLPVELPFKTTEINDNAHVCPCLYRLQNLCYFSDTVYLSLLIYIVFEHD